MSGRTASWLCALPALLLAVTAAGAELEGERLDQLPRPALEALAALAEALELGDVGRLEELIDPETRISSRPVLAMLAATPTGPRTEVRLRLSAWERGPEGFQVSALFQARTAPRRLLAPRPDSLTPEPGVQAQMLRIDWQEAGGRLRVETGNAAGIAAGRVEWRFEDAARDQDDRIQVRTELDLVPELPGARLVRLEVPALTTSLRLVSPELPATWFGDPEEGGGQLVVELPRARPEGLTLVLEHEAGVPDDIRAGGDTLYLSHGSVIAPWSWGRFHLWDCILDIPADLEGVSIGAATVLDAPEGRKRIRYRTDRLIDYPGIAVGRFRVDKKGPVELWRVAQVGGSANKLIAELETLVEFHESRVAPLPYGAFRLVEVGMKGAGAVSYASVIFMNTSVMATDKQRYAILSHEVAHQWWGNAVQGDQHTRWISEGMANGLMGMFVERQEGEDEKQDLLDRHRQRTLDELKAGALPLAHVRGRSSDYYERGSLFVHALREVAGDELFWKILQAWYAEHSGPDVGTPELRATAERVAGRSLAEVFDPWLGTTALPWLELDYELEGATGRLRIRQEEPAFALRVPVEAMLRGGRSEWRSVELTGALTEHEWSLDEAPLAFRLDPKKLTPRVREDERVGYLLGEADACLARGETGRGLALLERAEQAAGSELPRAAELRDRTQAREGRRIGTEGAQDFEAMSLATSEELASALSRLDEMLGAGRAHPALILAERLAERVDEGAALPLRRAHALRLLGREDEARAEWEKAHQRRPDHPAPRQLLGLAAAEEDEPAEPLLDEDDDRLDGSSPRRVRLLAASAGRWGLVLPGSRAILLGTDGALERVPGYTPGGLVDGVVVDAGSERPLVVALEGGRRSGRLTILEWADGGGGELIERHERIPGRAQGLLGDGSSVFVSWKNRDGDLDWYRFSPDLRGAATPGPDDRDGLLTLKVAGDDRFEKAATTPKDSRALVIPGVGFAWLDTLGVLRNADGVVWEQLEDQWAVLDLRRAGQGAGLLLGGDRSRSPFREDGLPERKLVVVDPERLVERELPLDALQALLAPDGSVLVLHGYEGCGGRELRVTRLPPPGP